MTASIHLNHCKLISEFKYYKQPYFLHFFVEPPFCEKIKLNLKYQKFYFMRKTFFIIILFLSVQSLSAQSSFSEIKKHHSWAWLGLDFSNTKLLESEGFNDPKKIIDHYFIAWNQLIFDEGDKYNVMKAFKLKQMYTEDSYFDLINSKVKLNELFADRSYRISESDIKNIVEGYNLSKIKQKIVLVFIAERLDKPKEQAVFWVTLINSRTKEIILTERMIGKPGGFGFRNYWAGAVYDIIKQIKKKKYKQWKKM